MRAILLYISVGIVMALLLVGCVQPAQQSTDSNQIAITGQAPVTQPAIPAEVENSSSSDISSALAHVAGDEAAAELDSALLDITGLPLGLGLPPPSASQSQRLGFVTGVPKPVAPFPLVLNAWVRQYVNAFVAEPAGLKRSFRRSQPYLGQMAAVLENAGLPRDLVYLAFAESGFSHVGAGPWQLSRATARRYGLMINHWVDERRDPIRSTRAAAEYLATLHDESGDDWRMTLIAWNNGDTAIGRFMSLEGASYARLMARLPRRTRALMNRFMAVALIARNARQYGLEPVSYNEPVQYHQEAIWGGTRLRTVARREHTTVAMLRELNPALLHDRVPPEVASYEIRIPDAELEAQLQNTL
ncbi:MAG: lytic transglycosylase domain-containing protein [Candidatus Binataceae bacterium]